ncbi:hypothetical protein, partial [uncultured Dialister sp.]|uniref:hypothetical protein n=1 Tax=uncultured Dialister sp. TaxID=278064 RepID=UPI0025D4BADC
DSFLSGMGTLRINAVGNFLRIVSCPARQHCVSTQQETFREQFPVRHGSIVYQRSRKLFADSFLSGTTALRINAAGNFLRIVSCPA